MIPDSKIPGKNKIRAGIMTGIVLNQSVRRPPCATLFEMAGFSSLLVQEKVRYSHLGYGVSSVRVT